MTRENEQHPTKSDESDQIFHFAKPIEITPLIDFVTFREVVRDAIFGDKTLELPLREFRRPHSARTEIGREICLVEHNAHQQDEGNIDDITSPIACLDEFLCCSGSHYTEDQADEDVHHTRCTPGLVGEAHGTEEEVFCVLSVEFYLHSS